MMKERDNQWRVDQYNRNRPSHAHINRVEEMNTEEKVFTSDEVLAEIKANRLQAQEDLLDTIAEINPDAILLEPQEIYNNAIYGYDSEGRVVYLVDGIIGSLMKDGMTQEEAVEFFEFNTLGTFMGMSNPNKPIFIYE